MENAIVSKSFDLINSLKVLILKNKNKSWIFPSDFYRKEMATIKISLPRRTGNTTIALKCFKQFKDSILIVNDVNSYNRIIENNPTIKTKKKKIFRINFELRGLNSKIVIVDTASNISKKNIEKIYGISAEVYVFIG